MRSRTVRSILGTGALLALGAAAFFIYHTERRIADTRVAERAFDGQVREALDGLADLRVSQAAYVAAGQGVAFWMPKVAATADDVTKTVAALRAAAQGEEARAILDEATATVAEFGNVDRRARDYLKSGLQLMAGDVIFTEGGETAVMAAQQVDTARADEHQAVDAAEAGHRKQEALALAGAAAVAIVVLLVLVLLPTTKTVQAAPSIEQPQEPSTVPAHPNTGAPAAGDDLVLRDAVPRDAAPDGTPRYVTARPAGPVLRAASQLCTNFGRVSDLEELKTLLGQAADLMDASGLVVWVGSSGGAELRPALAHGYGPQALARMPTLPRSADNAAAAAFRTSQLQIVLARPGSSNGAVVAPLLSADGCVGALSAEIRGGGETSESVQALAAIFAAQLSGVLHTTPAAHEQRATATGTV